MQKNSSNVSANQYHTALELDRPPGVQDFIKAKKKCYERNKLRKHSMLSKHATKRAQQQFPDGELDRVIQQVKDIEQEEASRLKSQYPAILGKR